MKELSFILLIILLGSSCRKKEEIPIDTSFYDQFHWGTASAKINGVEWIARPGTAAAANNYQGIEKGAIALKLTSYKGNFPVTTISFNRINTRIGKYYLKPFASDTTVKIVFPSPSIKNCSYLHTIIGGDVIADSFQIYERDSLNNYLTVTSYDSITTEIKGTFNATYYCPNPKYTKTDTVKFTNGVFHAKKIK